MSWWTFLIKRSWRTIKSLRYQVPKQLFKIWLSLITKPTTYEECGGSCTMKDMVVELYKFALRIKTLVEYRKHGCTKYFFWYNGIYIYIHIFLLANATDFIPWDTLSTYFWNSVFLKIEEIRTKWNISKLFYFWQNFLHQSANRLSCWF